MSSSYSISEAKDRLARLVHEAESEGPVELTRRGRPVAVVLGLEDYRRLTTPKLSPWQAIEQFRARHDMEELDIDPDELLDGARDAAPGREFSW